MIGGCDDKRIEFGVDNFRVFEVIKMRLFNMCMDTHSTKNISTYVIP